MVEPTMPTPGQEGALLMIAACGCRRLGLNENFKEEAWNWAVEKGYVEFVGDEDEGDQQPRLTQAGNDRLWTVLRG